MNAANLMIVQGGGPTAVFNISLAAIIEEAQLSSAVARIYGARGGTLGVIRDDLADLTDLSPGELAQLRRTPGAALRSSRHKPAEAELERLIETLQSRNIGYLVFLGGNGTMRGAHLIGEACRARGLDDIRIVGVPKTIDNDIAETDRCPGFGSAARYCAIAARELGADLRSLPQPITILETMGRNAGWLAAASILGRGPDEPAPQIICLPELSFDEDVFVDELDRLVRSQGWAVAVVAEGLRNPDGSMVWENRTPSQADPLGRPMPGGVGQYLSDRVSSRLKLRCRSERPGLLGRASVALASEQDCADAELVGRVGVRAVLEGSTDVMVALDPIRPGQASGHRLVAFTQVAGNERCFPRHWLTSGPLPLAPDFLDYVTPLVGPLEEHLVRLPAAPSLSGVSFA
jgi:6-phosphofructokinase